MLRSVGTRPHVVTDNTLIRYKISEGVFSSIPYDVDWVAFQKAVDKINKLKEESNVEIDRHST